MNPIALAGLLFAAILHAIWNLFVKRGRDNQSFLVSAAACAMVMLAPLAWLRGTPVPADAWPIIILSGALEATYYLLLGAAYRGGDLSFVYPISRGSSPLFVVIFALAFQGERIAAIGAFGIVLTVIGIYVVHLKSFAVSALLEPLRAIVSSRTSQLALLTGMTIAGYSVVDKAGVAHVDQVVYIFWVFLISTSLVMPYMFLRRREALIAEWRLNWKMIVLVGFFIGGGYLIILLVLATTKVSYATSVRTASVVFGAALGALVLKEPLGDKKILGAAIIFTGIICIGFAT